MFKHCMYLTYQLTKHLTQESNATFFSWIENAPETDKKDLLSELELLKRLRPHPHVIKLVGCVSESGKTELKCVYD